MKDPSGAGDSSSAPEARYGAAPDPHRGRPGRQAEFGWTVEDPEGPDEYYSNLLENTYLHYNNVFPASLPQALGCKQQLFI